MDRLCQYSTIIFAGNVSVLIIVAIMTDYWEYRGFNLDAINKSIPAKTNTTLLTKPIDTESYLLIRYFWDARAGKSRALPTFPGNSTHYQSPALVYKYYNNGANAAGNTTVATESERHRQTRVNRVEDVIILYSQYGNLFRDCDSLEAGVRSRLGLAKLREARCLNFITSFRNGDYIYRELPAVIHLERAGFLFAVICIISSVISVGGGAYGSLAQERGSILTASTAALISGMTLTVSIALFHGKCHLIHRREFMAGLDIPYKKIINDSRYHEYGWSFILCWICVVLCFVHSWVWLRKSQDMQIKMQMRYFGHKAHQLREVTDMDYGFNNEFVFLTSETDYV